MINSVQTTTNFQFLDFISALYSNIYRFTKFSESSGSDYSQLINNL